MDCGVQLFRSGDHESMARSRRSVANNAVEAQELRGSFPGLQWYDVLVEAQFAPDCAGPVWVDTT